MHITRLVGLASLALMIVSCGQEPSFLQEADKRLSTTSNGSGSGSGSGQGADANAAGGSSAGGANGDAQTAGDFPGADGGNGSQNPTSGGTGAGAATAGGATTGAAAGTATGTGQGPSAGPPSIPGADPGDLGALQDCLALWPDNPFTGTVQNYRKIEASVTVGGIGNAINDTQATAQPYLILIDAGVNVLGTPTYNLMNPNGYYCMKVNVNVLTELTVNLDCNAHLADSRVDVNVLSNQNDTTSEVGVTVLSSVQVDTVRPQGESCLR